MSKSKGRKLAEWLRDLNSNSKASTASIADDAVTNPKIADGAIHTANLADANVTFAKLHTAVTVTSSTGISASNDNDTTLPTTAALIDYVGAQIQTKDNSDEITEGSTNLYYTDARVASYLSTNGYGTSSSIIASITDSAPTTLDTLNELAAALGDDANFSTTVTNSIATKWTQDNTKISNWDTAYSWGNHASAGYASASSVGGGAQYVDVATGNFGTIKVDDDRSVTWAGYAIRDDWVFMSDGAQNSGIYNDTDNNWAIQWARGGGTTVQGNFTATGTLSASGYNNSNWDTAYSWGNHASAGYLTSFNITTQTDPKYLRSDVDDQMLAQLSGGFGAVTTGGTTDWNHSTNARSGGGYTLLTGSASNGPGGSTYYHPFSFEYSSKNGNGNMTQLAIPYNGFSIWHRYRYSNSWSGWAQGWNSANDGSGSGLDADTLDGVQGSSYLRSDADDTVNAGVTYTWSATDTQGLIFQNASYPGNYLYIGGWTGTNSSGISRIRNSNANLHLDSGSNGSLYLNHYSGGAVYARQNVVWHAGNDGSGSGLDADTVDGIQGSSLMRLDTTQTVPDGVRHIYECYGNIVTTAGSQSSLEVFNNGVGTDAFMTFHVGGDYAAYFGLDGGSNDLAYGGWSAGATSYKVWHAANDGSGSGLDADTVDGQHATSLVGTHNGHNRAIQAEVGALHFYSDGGNSGQSAHSYAIFQESGAWSNPYPDLRIAFHTGISVGAQLSYGGVRFFTTESMTSRVLQVNGTNNYIYKDVWLHTDLGEGMYSVGNGAHFYPNSNTSYTPWSVSGSKGGYGGFVDVYSNNHMMWDAAGNGGNYRETNGRWIYYHHISNNCTGFSTSTTSSSYTIYSNGGIYSTGNITAYSDRRVKENIIQIDSALDKVNKLEGVYYNKINDETKTKEIGFIAQDVQEVVPELVTYAEDVDEYGVKYGNATALLVEAIKELTQKVKELEKKLEEK